MDLLNRWQTPLGTVMLTVVLAACSGPTDDKPAVVIDMGGQNNQADSGDNVDPNNLNIIDEGCQILGCPDELVCNTATGICVDCVTNAECGANGTCDPTSNKCSCEPGFHLCDGACASNDSVDSCGSSCDPCPTDPNGTATCDGSSCGLTCEDPLILDPGTNSCVGCTTNNDCGGASASVCAAGGACEPCADNAGCAHVPGLSTCDGGTCVECTAADDSACAGNSCDLFDGTCTTTPKESVDVCEACLADSECVAGHACVQMQFAGDLRSGGFCLPLDTGECVAPYPVADSRTSLSNASVDICTLNEELTTCEALADYRTPNCSDDSDCGAPGLDDGLCEPIEFEAAHCTIPCASSSECPAEFFGCNLGGAWCGSY